jgi:hypothetical protein
VRPTAFPDVKPVGPRAAREFAAGRVPPVLESDPPLRKLQKAKLRAAWECFAAESRDGYIRGPRVSFESITAALGDASREAVAAGLELAQKPEDRRAWLEFGVGMHKDIEAVIAEGVNVGTVRPGLLWSARWHRIGAEIALQRHIARPGVAPGPDKPDPGWNEGAILTRRQLDGLKKHTNDPASPRRPADRGRVRPTAFPDIGPVGPKELAEFVAGRTPQVLDSDPPLRKLQKAKMQAAWVYVVLQNEFRFFGDPKMTFETTVASLFDVAREAVAAGLELAERPEDRRAWLAFRVGLGKEFEAFLADRIKAEVIVRPTDAWLARRHRLDAEIALLRHVQESAGKAK